MILHYTFDEHGQPVPEPDVEKFVIWFCESNRKVADDFISDIHVSTIFLGINSNLRGPPVLWETMIFGGPLHYRRRRCAGGREQAEAMHAEAVADVKAQLASAN